MGRVACLVGTLGWACSGGPPSEPVPAEPSAEVAIAQAEAQAEAQAIAAAEAQAVASATPAPKTSVAPGGSPDILLVWDNVGDLYQSFFAHTGPISDLSTGLAGHANGPVNVHIRWDQEEFVGTIRLRVLPGTLIEPSLGQGELVPLQELAPLTTALAAYRSDVAGRFDVRVASFKVALESFSGARHCVFDVAGKPPPDGRLVSPCVVLNGQKRCGSAEAEGVRFSAGVAEDIRACLQPKG